ncbi:MAG: tetratricopeptide repeat protein, partial [Phycisphaerales bacterium]
MQQPGQQNQPTPKQVFEEAHRLMKMGDLYEAARRAGKLRMHFPEDTPILTLHGLVLARLGVHPQALHDLIRAAQQTEAALQKEDDENPARPRIIDQLIRLSVQICRSSVAIGEYAAAEEAIKNALDWDPERGDAVGAQAELLAAQGKHEEALKLIDKGQKEKMDALPLVLAKAQVLLMQESAGEEALGGVAGELDKQAQVAGQSALDLGDLLRTLGEVYDRLGRYDDAFASFRRAAKLRRGGYDPRNYTTMTTKVVHDWSAQNMSKIVRPEEPGERYVFLLGAPKSGVEELAAMLAQFDGATVIGPLETLSSICVRHLNARQGVLRPVPLEPQKLRGAQIREAADAYRTQVAGHCNESTVRAIDTHPLNIPLAGAAALMLPGVKIVMCRRNPIEATLACYCDAMP